MWIVYYECYPNHKEYLGNYKNDEKPFFSMTHKTQPLKFESKEEAYKFVENLDYYDCRASECVYEFREED